MQHFFFGEDGERRYGVYSRPSGPARVGLIFSPPLGEEMISTYARIARWAKDLAGRGIAVMRYHPRGTGESDGGSVDFTLKSAAEDAAAAVKWMRQHGNVDRVGILGLRFGASAAVYAEAQADFLIFWSPVVNLRNYFRDLLRTRIAKDMLHFKEDSPRVSTKELTMELEAGRAVDLLGYETSPEMYRQMKAIPSWPEEPPAADVLWLAHPEGKAQGESVASGWQSRGCRVQLKSFREPVFWEDFSLDFPHQFAEETLAWVEQQATGTSGAR
jgi:exosortase A-associated hydrolase 2